MSSEENDDQTSDDPAHEPEDMDPRNSEVEGDEGFPGTFVDTANNMPGDQPEEDDPPTKSEMYGRD